eukprot:TRINITY_DN64283_c0_g1_i1.p1 TRINITY_DN64283_c0_g1~~TRINITY_DN64283_c0_g1_i1.p1  ORF type:complete len:140 (+),score=2.55 TRINITY_DN64283_c0_g1_i1:155-574(+)
MSDPVVVQESLIGNSLTHISVSRISGIKSTSAALKQLFSVPTTWFEISVVTNPLSPTLFPHHPPYQTPSRTVKATATKHCFVVILRAQGNSQRYQKSLWIIGVALTRSGGQILVSQIFSTPNGNCSWTFGLSPRIEKPR